MINILKLCRDEDMYLHLIRKYGIDITDLKVIGYRRPTSIEEGEDDFYAVTMSDEFIIDYIYKHIASVGNEINKLVFRYIASKNVEVVKDIAKLTNQPFKKYFNKNEFTENEIANFLFTDERQGKITEREIFISEIRNGNNLPEKGSNRYRDESFSDIMPSTRILRYLNKLIPKLQLENEITKMSDRRIFNFVVKIPKLGESLYIFEDENAESTYDEVVSSEDIRLATNPTKLYVYGAERLADSETFDKDCLEEDITNYIKRIAQSAKYSDINIIFNKESTRNKSDITEEFR